MNTPTRISLFPFKPLSEISLTQLRPQHWLVGGAGLIFFLFLMLFRQPLYPAPWFDEGLNVTTAAMLAREGLYALPDSSGPRILDPAIQTGPPVLLPIALAFQFFGVSLMPARLVMLAFALFAFSLYVLLTRRLLDTPAMILAMLFLLIGNREQYTSFVYMGRQVLGEVPALGFFLLGLLLWWRAIEQTGSRWPTLVLAGLAWGLAMVTKSQVLLLLPVSLGLLALLNHFYYRQVKWSAFIIPGVIAGGCVAIWYATQIAMIGMEQFQRNSLVLREGFQLHIVGLNPIHWRNALSVIRSSGWWLWGAPGLAWGIWLARHRTQQGFYHAVALALPTLNLFWFTGLSVGWGRYAFYTFVLSSLWTAGLLVAMWRGDVWPKQWPGRRWLVGSLAALFILLNGRPVAQNLITPVDTGYSHMTNYLVTQIPAEAVIESWEWEMSLEVPQPIHHPPTQVANDYTASIYSGHSLSSDQYDAGQAQPAYILTGPFSNWTGIYKEILQTQAAQVVASFGGYTLYRLQP